MRTNTGRSARTAGAYDDWHEGRDPAGITTQDPTLAQRLDPVAAGRKLANYLAVLTLEAQTIARACGKTPRPQSRAGRSGRAHRRGRGDGARAAGGHRLDSGDQQILSTKAVETQQSGPKRQRERAQLMASLGEYAKQKGIKYFLISFIDLFGTMRAKIVPATAIDAISKSGAGFAGFADWFDMTPAHPDILAMPDPDSVIQLPWKPEVAWVTGDLIMDGKAVEQNPRQVLKRVIAKAAAQGYELKPASNANIS